MTVLSTYAPTISSNGISSPSFAAMLASLQEQYQGIFGNDAVLDNSSQDGQLLGIFCAIMNDINQAIIGAYNDFSPTTAVGTGLSSIVKINGLLRLVPSNSTALVTLIGVAGSTITNGIVGDNLSLNTQWTLPASVIIPISGSITVTAMCTTPGAVSVPANSLTQIITPTLGWQSVNNSTPSIPGAPVESDAALRVRQSVSTALPSLTVIEGMLGQILNVTGVERAIIYDNDTSVTDGNGAPPHTIYAVIEGGDVQTLINTIGQTKTPGTGTYGTTSGTFVDTQGVPSIINYFQLTNKGLEINISLTPLLGFASTTSTLIQQALAGFINSLNIGETSYLNRLFAPANLSGDIALNAINAYLISVGQSTVTQQQLDALAATYNISSIAQAIKPSTPTAADVGIAFNQAATLAAGDVAVTVL